METQKVTLDLPEGTGRAMVDMYSVTDIEIIEEIYRAWRYLCDLLPLVNSRRVNLPEGLSESLFCIIKDVWRCSYNISFANSSFDCYDPHEPVHNNRIQIKACSVLPDLTSFGPNSEWDRIYFIDFYCEGYWDGTFDIYEIDTDDVYSFMVNEDTTFVDQQALGKRPRFSIYNGLISHGRYISRERFRLDNRGIVQVDLTNQ
jgi:hypothetical protein